MPLSTDVNLPRNHTAIYPQRCIRCGDDSVAKTIRLWTHTLGWWTWALWVLGVGFRTDVPVCSRCGWKIRFQKIGGVVLTMLIAAAFLTFAWPYIRDVVPRPFSKWAALIGIFLCLGPYFLWEIIFPPAIDVTAYSESVDYEFRDAEYAMEFAELNDEAEWVKVS